MLLKYEVLFYISTSMGISFDEYAFKSSNDGWVNFK